MVRRQCEHARALAGAPQRPHSPFDPIEASAIPPAEALRLMSERHCGKHSPIEEGGGGGAGGAAPHVEMPQQPAGSALSQLMPVSPPAEHLIEHRRAGIAPPSPALLDACRKVRLGRAPSAASEPVSGAAPVCVSNHTLRSLGCGERCEETV